jgi:non-specific serine/threonine protein kinase
MAGAEYLTQDVLLALWDEMERAFAASLAAAKVGLQAFLTTLNRAWNLVGRVHFNLAENRRDPDQPFAFMATYTTRLSAQAKVQHVPLGQALREYAGAANRDKLLSLLLPVQRAAEHCVWLKPMIDAGDIFHPLRWGPTEASRFLQSVPELESAGVVVRMPVSWRASRPARPQVTATVGSRAPSAVGLDGLLDFQMGVMLDGEPLTEVEVATLLAGTENLVLLRGQWVEVDRARLQRTMEQFHAAEKLAARDGLTFAEAMRMLAGAGVTRDDPAAADTGWARVTAGPWLEQTLKELRAPDEWSRSGPALQGRCVPTKANPMDGPAGRPWSRRLLPTTWVSGRQSRCYLCCWWNRRGGQSRPEPIGGASLLLANWAAEIGKFAPGLKATPASFGDAGGSGEGFHRRTGVGVWQLQAMALCCVSPAREADWRFVILDEAQALESTPVRPSGEGAEGRARIVLTGTPVENHFGDLWSIFDFSTRVSWATPNNSPAIPKTGRADA